MTPTEQLLRQSLEALNETLDHADLAPDPARRDWPSQRTRVAALKAQLEQDVYGTYEAHGRDWSEENRAGARQAIAAFSAEVAAVLSASGDTFAASSLLKKALALEPDAELAAELSEGARDAKRYGQLLHARWLFRHKQADAARKLARQLEGGRGAIAVGARALLDAPTPLASAPSLFTLNGIGTSLYGKRDQRDGTYIGTRYFTLLFVPVVPLDAYRVADAQEGGYYFLGKVGLSGWQRLWQRGLVAAGALGLALWAGTAYYNAPERVVAREVSALEAKLGNVRDEKSREAALAAYEELIARHQGEGMAAEPMEPAALHIAQLATGAIPDTAIAARLDAALGALRRVRALDASARGGAVASFVEATTRRWVQVLGRADSSQLYAAVRLCREARRTLPESAQGGLGALEKELSLALGESLATAWPIESFRAYMEVEGDPAALARAGERLASLGDSMSLTIELAPEIKAWLVAADEPAAKVPEALRTKLRERLAKAAAYARDHDFSSLIEKGDEASLKKALADNPGDQRLAVAVAALQRDHGQLAEAQATLDALGSVGSAIHDVQHMHAELMRGRGDLAGADRILTVLLESELPRYEESRDAYYESAERFETNMVEKARAGTLPQSISERLNGLSDNDAQKAFGEWLRNQLEVDPALKAKREKMSAHAAVVPAALTLGMVKLERASDAQGEERQRLLDAAERAFLAIQGEAAGLPAYHLSLGQVYYRLGKPGQGEAEFAKVLANKDDELTLSVAHLYRDLGVTGRSKQLAESIFNGGGEHKFDGALLRSLLASTPEERETWLLRCDQDVPYVKHSLLELKAGRLYDAGDYGAAEKAYGAVENAWAESADATSTGSNNAAIAAQRRYACSGELDHLDRAIERLDHAITLSPGVALVYGNATPTYRQRAELAVLSKLVTVKALHLSAGQTEDLLGTLLHGGLRAGILEELRKHPDFRKAATLSRQAETLGPNELSHYQDQLTWLSNLEDDGALAALASRAEGQKLDLGEAKDQYERWLKGERDAEARAIAERTLVRLEALSREIAKLQRPHDEAALAILLGSTHQDLVHGDDATAHLEQAVAAFERAARLWPESGAEDRLADALLALSIRQAIATSPAVRDAYAKTGRELGDALFVYTAMQKHDAPVLEAVKSAPALPRWHRLRTDFVARFPQLASLDDLTLGQLLGDEKLSSTATASLRQPTVQVAARVYAALSPFSEGTKLYSSVVRKLSGS